MTTANRGIMPSRPLSYLSFIRLIKVSIIVVVAALIPGLQAWADTGGSTLGTEELKTIFFELTTANTEFPTDDIEITHFKATPESITLPPGIMGIQVISPARAKQLGRQTIVADILVDGAAQERVTLSGDIELYGPVLCAQKPLTRRSIIEASDVEQVRRNITMLGPDIVVDKDKAIGMELKTTLQPGAVLFGRFLKSPETVKRGDIVAILAASGTLTVSVPGRVQTAGAIGDLIKVKNMMSRREIFARVTGPDTVQVDL